MGALQLHADPQNLHARIATWMNLGYWSTTLTTDGRAATRRSKEKIVFAKMTYVQACEAHARRTLRDVPIEQTGPEVRSSKRASAQDANSTNPFTIVDVGFGWGDQIAYYLKHIFRHHSDVCVYGVNSGARQVQHARDLMRIYGLAERTHLFQGSATSLLTALPSTVVQHADLVLAIDCAYHFAPKDVFLQQAFRLLKPQGRLALSDLVLYQMPSSWLGRLTMRFLAALCDVPMATVTTTTEQYEHLLGRCGFEDIRIEDATAEVLLGFASFVDQQRQRVELYTPSRMWLKFRVAAWLNRWVAKHDVVRYVFVSARKRSA